MPMSDRQAFNRVSQNGHGAVVVDDPISDGAISRGLFFSRVRSGLILIRELALIAAAGGALWCAFRIAGSMDAIVGLRALNK